MKALILAGGLGSRISEETVVKPKPMVEIGGFPILWHIMKIYSYYRIKDFIILSGYKQEIIKQFFLDYSLQSSDFTISLKKNSIKVHKKITEDWNVTILDTGKNTMTGGRILKAKNYLKKNEDFCLTYGDGLSNININKLIKFHKSKKKIATMSVVQPSGRYGAVKTNKENLIEKFIEKPAGDGRWINGGFFVLNYKIFKYLKSDSDIWEQGPLQKICADKNLLAYKHNGFWKAMDTLSDKRMFEEMWKKDRPWKIWND